MYSYVMLCYVLVCFLTAEVALLPSGVMTVRVGVGVGGKPPQQVFFAFLFRCASDGPFSTNI